MRRLPALILLAALTTAGLAQTAEPAPHLLISGNIVTNFATPQNNQGIVALIGSATVDGGSATVSNADITSTQGTLSGFLGPSSAPTVLTKQPDGSWMIAG